VTPQFLRELAHVAQVGLEHRLEVTDFPGARGLSGSALRVDPGGVYDAEPCAPIL
jgi:hypothetical protein